MDESELLINLVAALSAAIIGALIAVRLRQSVILGYILGGIAIGPYTPGFVGDPTEVEALANLGIILLMFAVGVQLSIGDLLRVGRVAILGATLQVIATIGLGYVVARMLGWDPLVALFFGAVVSNSSSTVLTKVLGERGELDATHGRIALAWSTVQDLSTIVLVVVLSTLATEGGAVLPDLALATAKAAVFLILLLPVGFRVLPLIFTRVAALKNREIFITTVAGFALGVAYVSSLFGLSLALGAFIAGVVVSESDLWHEILGQIIPLRDLFGGLFFVSVGMLVDPAFVLRNLPYVLVVVLMIVVVKGLLAAGITRLFHHPLRTAVLTGVALGQSAEFSFLLAGIGVGLGAIPSATFSLMLAGAAISIVLAPLLQAAADPAVHWIEGHLPEPALAQYPRVANLEPKLRGHAIICGYGRVGRVIGETLRRRDFPFIVIDQDPAIVQHLRDQGLVALLGSVDNPVLLDRAGVEQARVLVVAIPDALSVRRAVEHAKQANPRIDIVARTQTPGERAFLSAQGVREAVVGELELALEMIRFTLHRFGVSTIETQAILHGIRERSEAGDQRLS